MLKQAIEKTAINWSLVNQIKLGLILKAALILVASICGFMLFREKLVPLFSLLTDRTWIEATVQQWGMWGPVVLGILQFLQVIVAVLPGQGLYIASGYMYGTLVGGALSFAATVLASQLAFGLARFGGRSFVERLAPGQTRVRYNSFIERYGAWFFLAAFLIPLAPGDALNFAAGLSPVRWRAFLFASLFGRLPAAFAFAFVGSMGWGSLKALIQHPVTIAAAALLIGLLLLIAILKTGGNISIHRDPAQRTLRRLSSAGLDMLKRFNSPHSFLPTR